MSGTDKLRPSRLLILAGLLGVVFLLLLVLVAVRFGPFSAPGTALASLPALAGVAGRPSPRSDRSHERRGPRPLPPHRRPPCHEAVSAQARQDNNVTF